MASELIERKLLQLDTDYLWCVLPQVVEMKISS